MKNLKVTHIVVTEDEAGSRLDNFLLRRLPGAPKSHVQKIIRSGEVRVNKGRAPSSLRLVAGDEVRVPPVRIAEKTTPEAPPRLFPVVYEDEAILVIDKPPGIAVHGGSRLSYGIIEQLRQARPENAFLELAHRLDRDTSGLLVLAKKRSVLKALHELFRHGLVEKRYWALIKGRWRDRVRYVSLALEKFSTDEGERRVRVSREGKPAQSTVRLLRRWSQTTWGPISLVEVELETGRTHQIRVHLAHLGFPLLGDEKYGDFALNRRLQKEGLPRMFLHAGKIAFTHPVRGERLTLTAQLAKDLDAFLGTLGNPDETV